MVRRYWILPLLLLSLQAYAEPRLTAKLDKSTLFLGEVLHLELQVQDTHEVRDAIDVELLKRDFNVYAQTVSRQQATSRGRSVYSMLQSLTLYPLRSGKLLIPAISYLGKRSRELRVNVQEPTGQVLFRTALDNPKPMVRQALALSLEVLDDGTLQWTVPHQLQSAGMHQRWIGESQREEALNGVRYTVHRYAWELMPLREGSLQIEFPLLDAFRLGNRQRYPLAPLRVDAVEAPAWLPVQVPLGKLQVTVDSMAEEVAQGAPLNWVMKVNGSGLNTEALGKLLPLFRDDAQFRFYPLSIAVDETLRSEHAERTFIVTVPVVPLRSGVLSLPEFALPYFDVAGGRLASVQVAGPQLQVFSPFWRNARRIAALAVVVLILAGIGYRVYPLMIFRLRQRRLLRRVQRARNSGGMQQALLAYGGVSVNFTLQQWLGVLQRDHVVDEKLALVVGRLEQALYSQHVLDTGKLQDELIQALQQMRLKYSVFKLNRK